MWEVATLLYNDLGLPRLHLLSPRWVDKRLRMFISVLGTLTRTKKHFLVGPFCISRVGHVAGAQKHVCYTNLSLWTK